MLPETRITLSNHALDRARERYGFHPYRAQAEANAARLVRYLGDNGALYVTPVGMWIVVGACRVGKTVVTAKMAGELSMIKERRNGHTKRKKQRQAEWKARKATERNG